MRDRREGEAGASSGAVGRGKSSVISRVAGLGGPRSILGGPTSSLGRPTSVLGRPSTVLGRPTSSLGRPTSSLGRASSILGRPTSVLGRPTSVLVRASSILVRASSILVRASSFLVRASSNLVRPSSILRRASQVARELSADRVAPGRGRRSHAPVALLDVDARRARPAARPWPARRRLGVGRARRSSTEVTRPAALPLRVRAEGVRLRAQVVERRRPDPH